MSWRPDKTTERTYWWDGKSVSLVLQRRLAGRRFTWWTYHFLPNAIFQNVWTPISRDQARKSLRRILENRGVRPAARAPENFVREALAKVAEATAKKVRT